MSQLYIDRGFLNFNGVAMQDIVNITLSRNFGTKVVPTMTRDRRNKGFTKGNLEIKLAFGIAVQASLATPKLEDIDYETNNISVTFEHGGDRYTVTGIAYADDNQAASGVGTEGKKDFNFLALDVVDQVGNSALFSLGL